MGRPIFAKNAATITELKKNPTALINEAMDGPIVILNHNRPTAYLIPAEAYEALLERLEDYELCKIVKEREAEKKDAFEVDLDEI